MKEKNQLSSRRAIRLQYLVAFVENINFSIRSSGLLCFVNLWYIATIADYETNILF